MQPQNERTASAGRLCATCATSLNGRRPQARFCSDRCRTQHRREGIRQTVHEALLQAEAALRALADAVASFDRHR
jgi:predicted nucleic acid-binding Zn ribbon protein